MNKDSPFETVADLVPWLEGRGAEELRGWLREALEENSRLRQKLGRQAQRDSKQTLDLTVLKRQVVQATAPPPSGFVDWRGVSAYCDAMERACVDPLEELLQEGHAVEVVELAEWVLTLTGRASEHVQDAGEIGMIGDRLLALHLKACQESKPDGVALAHRFFQSLVSNPWSPMAQGIKAYQNFFGAAGLAELQRLAKERLAALPVPPAQSCGPTDHMTGRQVLKADQLRKVQMENIQRLVSKREDMEYLLRWCLGPDRE